MTMQEIRILIASKGNGNVEEVYFTDDLKAPAKDFFPDDYDVDNDETVQMEIPNGFPLEYRLRRV